MPKKGVVIPLGASGESDDANLFSPSIMFLNNFFYLYYGAGDGFNIRTNLAISKDGINFIKKGVVLPLGASGESDDKNVYFARIMFINNYFYLYYSGSDGSKLRFCLAISKDGINFVKKGVVLPLGAGGESDDANIYFPKVIFINNFFYLYYSAGDGTRRRTNLALSKDGINFIKKGVVIPLGASGESDDNKAFSSSVIFINNLFYLYYVASFSGILRVNLALSKDGINFVKKGVVIPLGAAGESDDNRADQASVIFINKLFYCYYRARDGAKTRIALAISKDGINFT